MKIIGGALLTQDSFQMLFHRENIWKYDSIHELKEQILRDTSQSWNLENFRRGCLDVKRAQMLAIASCIDSGLDEEEFQVISTFGINGDGCVNNNLEYWNDYVAYGKQSGRGGLFVATLPSTPFAEAMITLNAHGECVYLNGKMKQLKYLFEKNDGLLMLMTLKQNFAAALLLAPGENDTIFEEDSDVIDWVKRLLKTEKEAL